MRREAQNREKTSSHLLDAWVDRWASFVRPGGTLLVSHRRALPSYLGPLASEREKNTGRLLEFGEVPFAYVVDVVPDPSPGGEPIVYEAHTRYENPFGRALLPAGQGPFCRFRDPSLPHSPGVMLLTVDGVPAYVADVPNLNQAINLRFGLISPRQCYEGGDGQACLVNGSVLRATQVGQVVSLWFRATPNARQTVVRALVRHRQGGGAYPMWNPEPGQAMSKDDTG